MVRVFSNIFYCLSRRSHLKAVHLKNVKFDARALMSFVRALYFRIDVARLWLASRSRYTFTRKYRML